MTRVRLLAVSWVGVFAFMLFLQAGAASANMRSTQFTPKWNFTGNLISTRAFQTATRLKNGKVLIVGGSDATNTLLASAELYDPTTGT